MFAVFAVFAVTLYATLVTVTLYATFAVFAVRRYATFAVTLYATFAVTVYARFNVSDDGKLWCVRLLGILNRRSVRNTFQPRSQTVIVFKPSALNDNPYVMQCSSYF